jgi:small-conductance mechanosensitive channel
MHQTIKLYHFNLWKITIVICMLVGLATAIAQESPPQEASPAVPAQEQTVEEDSPEGTAADNFQLGASEFEGTALEETAEEREETETLNKRIQRILASIPNFQDITASVTDGVVTLAGSVPTAAARENALELVNTMDGVIYVVNDITLDTQVNTALNPVAVRLRDYWTNIIAFLPLIAVAIVVVIVFWFVARAIGRWQAPYTRLNVNALLRSFLRQLVRTIIFAIGMLLALDIVGATPFVTAILGTAGVAGLAVGFAFKDIIENYLAGILLSLRQPFNKSDFVQVGSHEGKVVRLTARELVLMTFDGNHVVIPNATVFKSEILNYSRNPRRRFDFVVGVDVQEDLSYVQTLGLDTLNNVNGVMVEPASFSAIDELGDFNVLVHFFGWVDQRSADFLKVRSQAIRLVKEAFDEAGVLMPEPINNVRVKQIPADAPLISASETGEDALPQAIQQDTEHDKSAEDIKAEARSVDVSIDTSIDEQIEEEEAASQEENLLEQPPTQKDPALVSSAS